MDFHCPTLEEITSATLALLPRGRAWQTNEGGPQPGRDIAFAPNAYQNDVFATDAKRHSVLWQYWRSFAVEVHFLTQRLCALREEFWCSSINETRDEWMVEYGLPDECDPFPDLCTKVTAIGGTRCEYYAEVAARMGWEIECDESLSRCGSVMNSRAGKAKTGSVQRAAKLRVIVHLQSSTAYSSGGNLRPLAGRLRAGRRMSCGPNVSPLQCLMSRVVHAEIEITYETSNT
jgi:hypothetical protein